MRTTYDSEVQRGSGLRRAKERGDHRDVGCRQFPLAPTIMVLPIMLAAMVDEVGDIVLPWLLHVPSPTRAALA